MWIHTYFSKSLYVFSIAYLWNSNIFHFMTNMKFEKIYMSMERSLIVCDIWGKSEKYTIFELIYQFSIENNCREHINRIKNNCSSKIILITLQESALQWNVDIFFNLRKAICWNVQYFFFLLLLTLSYAIKIILLLIQVKKKNTARSCITLKCWN